MELELNTRLLDSGGEQVVQLRDDTLVENVRVVFTVLEATDVVELEDTTGLQVPYCGRHPAPQ